MQGRFSMVVAGAALAVGGGVAGAVVVAPSMQPDAGSIAVRQAAGKDALATPQHTFQVAKKARGMARGARQLANSLVDPINQAQSDATQALSTAGNALNTADTALSTINSTKSVSDAAAGQATAQASNTDFQADAAGPRVTLNVPQSGLIEVWATVTVESDEGAVGLFEDGQLVQIPGQDGACDVDGAILMSQFPGPSTISTPPTPQIGLCGLFGESPGPILFRRSPGTHSYELRYADCGCDTDDAVFSNRTLRVAPRL